ncbi:unnamed protein product, partial [Rotaria sordida]
VPLIPTFEASVKNRRVDRISILLQEYNIEKIIHIKGQHNCLADYLSRHPIQHNEEIFDEEYGIGLLFNEELPSTVSVPDMNFPSINTVITRSKHKQNLQQAVISNHTIPVSQSRENSSTSQSTTIEPTPSYTCTYFTIECIKEEQAKDQKLQQIIQELKDKKIINSYIFQDGLLYKLLPMSPNSKKKIRAYHTDPLSGHFGVKRTYLKLKNKFWWPNYFTRWITAIALPNCSAQITAQTIFNDYICRYGVPKSILSDQGTHFNNQLMDAMAKLVGYTHIFSTVYHPQSNGMVERFNATFVPQLAKLHDRESNNWEEYLSPVVFAYNTSAHSTTHYSPFELQFGRKPRFPIDTPSSHYIFHTPNDYYAQLKKSLQIIHNNALLTKIHSSRSKLDPRYSITPKFIIKTQHPIYWVKDEITQIVSRVHVSDIRLILMSLKSTSH